VNGINGNLLHLLFYSSNLISKSMFALRASATDATGTDASVWLSVASSWQMANRFFSFFFYSIAHNHYLNSDFSKCALNIFICDDEEDG
jgi:hypothetical protein